MCVCNQKSIEAKRFTVLLRPPLTSEVKIVGGTVKQFEDEEGGGGVGAGDG